MRNFAEALAETAARVPDRVAFRCGKAQLTFAELDARATDLARTLVQGYGYEQGDRVALFLNRSIEVPVAIYGVMRAGMTWVPLNPRAPASRSKFQLEDAGCVSIVTNQNMVNYAIINGLSSKVKQSVINLGRVDGAMAEPTEAAIPERGALARQFWRRMQEEWVAPDVNGEDDAYVIYTSGSTGQPKGIVHTHASGLAFARNLIETFGLTEEDVLGGHAPVFFDVSQLALFAGPLLGATSVLATDAHVLFPTSLAQLIQDEGITAWYSVPLALTQMVAAGALERSDWSALRWCFYAGEPCPPATLRALMTAYPELRVGNLYGPAETNVCTTYVLPGPPEGDAPVPIGTAWRDTDYRIEDGELWIASTTQMRGYLGRPDLDAEAFRDVDGRRYYRTGDLVEEVDGLLHFRGRRDNQVKIRGYRVELGAVEAAYRKSNLVSEVVVIAGTGKDGNRALRAAVLPHPDTKPGAEAAFGVPAIEAAIRRHLPPYAVPECTEIHVTFPRTGSGKVDRPALGRRLFPPPAADDAG